MSSEQPSKLQAAGDVAAQGSGLSMDHPVLPCPLKDGHWVEIEILHDGDKPVANEPYLIIAADGREYRGKTDAHGIARVTGIADGQCKVCFTELDAGAWDAD